MRRSLEDMRYSYFSQAIQEKEMHVRKRLEIYKKERQWLLSLNSKSSIARLAKKYRTYSSQTANSCFCGGGYGKTNSNNSK